eukprot:Rmarinus@m.16320
MAVRMRQGLTARGLQVLTAVPHTLSILLMLRRLSRLISMTVRPKTRFVVGTVLTAERARARRKLTLFRGGASTASGSTAVAAPSATLKLTCMEETSGPPGAADFLCIATHRVRSIRALAKTSVVAVTVVVLFYAMSGPTRSTTATG